MINNFMFYRFLLIALLMNSSLCASDETSIIDLAHKVTLLKDRALEPLAKDLEGLRILRGQYDQFTSIQHHGKYVLGELGINGYGSAIIVWDTGFEQDLYNTLVFPKAYSALPNDENINDIKHATLVAACAASKYPASHGLAYGATIYTCANTFVTRDLEEIECIINDCLKTGSTKPRVINMSINIYNMSAYLLEYFSAQLTSLLQKHDMLLVISAGNRGKVITQDEISKQGLISLKSQLLAYPELLEHIIIVGAFDNKNENQPAYYSNIAGDLKDHVIFADGLRLYQAILLSKGLHSKANEDNGSEGTSFAAPIVTSLVDIIFKYFPHLSGQQIKRIILGSAAKEKGHDANIMGQGVMDPVQAWLNALESPVVIGPYSQGFHVDKIFFQNMSLSWETLTKLNLSGVKGLHANGTIFVEAVKQMVLLESINVIKSDLSNTLTVALVTVLEDKKQLQEVSMTMPYHWSNLFENEQKLICSSWECVKRKPIFTLCILERAVWPIVLGWPIDLLADAVLLQGQDYDSTCYSLAKIVNLKKVKLHLRNWIKLKDWTNKQINEARHKIDQTLTAIQVNFEE